MITLFKDFVSLLFPDLCGVCQNPLYSNENVLCLKCLYELPEVTNINGESQQLLSQLQGHSKLEHILSPFIYSSKGILSSPMHSLKYKGNQLMGIYLGELLGSFLMNQPPFSQTTLIIPTPLHPSKLRSRGFNQSSLIARGVASKLKVPLREDILIRELATESQTLKNKWERESSPSGHFRVANENLYGQNILIIDDIITTGATISACAKAFDSIENIRLFAASVAYTKK